MYKYKNNVGAGPVSARSSKARQNNGITLIALVITIIVMLILVAVTISMAVNGGLFDYAGKAGEQTNAAIANEQELANLEANMTVDELIDKYTEDVDVLELVNIGDYVKYPVEYENVVSHTNWNGTEEYYPQDKLANHWRVLSKITDENGKVQYVKLVSAGIPLSYNHHVDSATSVENLTTNFLTTEISPTTLVNYKFYKCGFELNGATNLSSVFSNNLTDNVQALTKNDVDSVLGVITQNGQYINAGKNLDLVAVPLTGGDSSACCINYLATGLGSQSLYMIGYDTNTYTDAVPCIGNMTLNAFGVRPVVSLKSNVKFSASVTKINETATWDISI